MTLRRSSSSRRYTIIVGTATAALTVLAACSDAPSAPHAPDAAASRPSEAPSASVSTVHASPVTVTTLRRTSPLPKAITASVTLYNSGGAVQIREAGLTVNIPKTALPASDRPITITVTALAGSQVAYEFGPSGTRFLAPLKITQELTGTSWAGNTGNTPLQADYFKSIADLSPSTNSALSYESLPTVVSATGNRLHWDVWHFSGYMVSTGRTR